MHFSAARREGGSLDIARKPKIYGGPAGGPISSTDSSTGPLTQGPPYTNNDRVTKMQTYLENLGYSVGSTGIDGKYGWRTANAVANFKRDYKLPGDGSTWDKNATAMLQQIDIGKVKKVKPTPTNTDQPDGELLAIESLANMRQRFKQELANPNFLNIVLALTLAEVGGSSSSAQRALLETLMNRASAYNKSIYDEVHNGYYHAIKRGSNPMNSKLIRQRLQELKNPEIKQRVLASLNDVLAGSNDSNLALHNGSANVAKNAHAVAHVRAVINGETFYNKTNPKGDSHYSGGTSGVRNKEARWVNQFEKSIQDEKKEEQLKGQQR